MGAKSVDRPDLTSHTALITGAAGLLGIEHAAALAELGAKIILTDVSEIALEKAVQRLKSEVAKVQVETYLMDVTDQSAIAQTQLALQPSGGVAI